MCYGEKRKTYEKRNGRKGNNANGGDDAREGGSTRGRVKGEAAEA